MPGKEPRLRRKEKITFDLSGATPNTRKSVNKMTLPNGATAISASEMQPSPNGRHALSPGNTQYVQQNQYNVSRQNTNGTNSSVNVRLFQECGGLTPSEKSKARQAIDMMPSNATQMSSGPITPADLINIPARSHAPSQNTVMGGQRARDEIIHFLQQHASGALNTICSTLSFGPSHWCHLLAYCLTAGMMNPQNPGNMLAGPANFNWSQKHYEVALRNLMLSNNYSTMQMTAIAQQLQSSLTARSIQLIVTFTTHTNTELNVDVTFNAFHGRLESSTGAHIMRELLETLRITPPTV